MRHTNFAPLYRSFFGFDPLANQVNSQRQQSDQSPRAKAQPAYNIEVLDKDNYQITLVVAGFTQDQLNIQYHQGALTVTGSKASQTDEQAKPSAREFLHQGIDQRDFERQFQLDQHVKVTDAKVKDGLLTIALKRELPEALKPRKIAINGGEHSDLLS